MVDFSSAPFCLKLMIGNRGAPEFCGPASDHAPQCVPAVSDNQHDMRYHEHYEGAGLESPRAGSHRFTADWFAK
jgi:hypothetical protein